MLPATFDDCDTSRQLERIEAATKVHMESATPSDSRITLGMAMKVGLPAAGGGAGILVLVETILKAFI